MEKEILLNQLEKMITNIKIYTNGYEKKESISTVDFETLQKQVKNKEFVITVVGAMKSGKSSFTNALLGNDLMPNENQACTLTSTDIIHQEHDFRIQKSYESGKSEILESENLSSIFHEDVRKSRTEVQNEFYTYKVHHPIYGLKKYPFLNDIDFILMDTPGLNEMEGLGVKKETIEQVFSHALRRTDLLLFVVDVQYYKSEENLQIIEKVRQLRPDLLDHMVFVLNKVDKLRARDGDRESLVHKVKNLFHSWGVSTQHIYPVSARKALIGRLVEQGVPISNLEDEITSFLPTKTIEVEGQAVTVQIPIASAYTQLIEDSGIPVLEEQIVEEAYLQVENKLLRSSLVRLSQIANQADSVLQKGITRNQAEIQEMERTLHGLQQKLSSLESLHTGERTYRNELEVILRNIRLQADTMRKEKPFSSKLIYGQEKISTYRYSSSSEALQVGISKFDAWFYKNTEPKFQSILSHYQAMLEYQPTGGNYFHDISQVVSGILKEMNRVISTCSVQLPEVKFHKLIEQLDIRPQGLSNIPSVDWKYQEFSKKIFTDSKTTEWEESFLLFFTQKKSKTEYMYDCTWAFNQAEKHIQETLDKYSKEWHVDTLQKRYTDIAKYVEEMVLKPLTQLHNKVEPLMKETSAEILRLESKLAQLQMEVVEMEELKQDVGFRTDIITRRKSITVTAQKQNLDSILSRVESGTTVYLEDGTFILKQKHELNKSISFVGLGKRLTKIRVEKGAGITVKGNQGVFLEGITFETSQADRLVEIDCEEFFVENCNFVSNYCGRALFIKGKTEGYIQRSSFSSFEKGITLHEKSKLRVRNNEFNTNSCGLHLIGHGESQLVDNVFIGNSIGVRFGDHSIGTMKNNTFTHNSFGTIVSEYATSTILDNQFNRNKESGISVMNKASVLINKNNFSHNNIGSSCSDQSKAMISHNTFQNHHEEGVRFSGKASGEINDNRLVENNIGIVISLKATAVLSRNQIVRNQKHGVLCQHESEVTAVSNHVEHNQDDGLVCEGNSQVTLRENVFSSNRRNGIQLTGKCKVLLVENQSNDNVENGIVCLDKASGEILNNSCHGNGSFSVLLKKPLLIHLKKNSGKGALERPSSIRYWVNQCRKVVSNLAAIIKKKEIFHHEY